MSRRSEISEGVEVLVTRRMAWGKSSRDVERSRAIYQLRTSLRVYDLRLVGASRRFLSCSTTVKWGPGRDLVISRAVNETSRLPSFEVLRSWKLITLSYQYSQNQYVGQLTQSLDKLFPLVPIPPSQMSTLSTVLA